MGGARFTKEYVSNMNTPRRRRGECREPTASVTWRALGLGAAGADQSGAESSGEGMKTPVASSIQIM